MTAALLFLAGGLLASPTAAPDIQLFFDAASTDQKRARAAQDALTPAWRDGYASLLVELARFMRSSPGPAGADGAELATDDVEGKRSALATRDAPVDPGISVRRRLIAFLQKRTGQRFGDDLRAWRRWMWSLPYDPHPEYAFFKAAVYARVDRRMAAFFPPGSRADIRLDEVEWGGVAVNGIPPLGHGRTDV